MHQNDIGPFGQCLGMPSTFGPVKPLGAETKNGQSWTRALIPSQLGSYGLHSSSLPLTASESLTIIRHKMASLKTVMSYLKKPNVLSGVSWPEEHGSCALLWCILQLQC